MPARNLRWSLALGGLLVAFLIPLVAIGDLRAAASTYVILIIAATAVFYLGLFLLRRFHVDPPPYAVIAVALLLRAVVFPLEPSLSDDAWRYVWDGRMVIEGENPYTVRPEDSDLKEADPVLYNLQGHPESTSIYPPVTQLFFVAADGVGQMIGSHPRVSYYVWKLLLLIAEMTAVLLLCRMLAAQDRPMGWAAFYAWHPLVVIELAGQGHTDGLWVLGLGLGLYGFLFARRDGGLFGAAWSVATRLQPVFALPLWIRHISLAQLRSGLLRSTPLILISAVLFVPDVFRQVVEVSMRFTNYLEFNGGVYHGVKWVVDELHLAPSNAIAGGILFGAMLAVVAIYSFRRLPDRGFAALVTGVLWITTAYTVLSPKIHLWYFAAPLFLVAAFPEKRMLLPWMWIALAGQLSYLYYAVTPHGEQTWILWLEWGVFGMLLFVGPRLLAIFGQEPCDPEQCEIAPR